MKFEPHGYQRSALAWLYSRTICGEHEGAALFLDPGLGKTAVALTWLSALLRLRLSKAALVVAPLRVVYSVWPGEVRKWEQFAGLRLQIIHGSPAQRLRALNTPADIYLVNPEGLGWVADQVQERAPFDALVVDESSKFKNWGARRTKALRKLCPSFSRRLILTGTPSPNGLADLFAQAYICDRGEALGSTITKFRNRYFYRGGYRGYQYIPIETAERSIFKALGGLCLRMSASEYLDLPELVENDVWVDLPATALKKYKQLERELFLDIEEDGALIPANAGARYNSCRQIAQGGIYDAEDKGTVHQIHSAKIEAVRELVGELQGKPALIAIQYQHDLERLRQAFGIVPAIVGDTKAREADKLIEDWNRGELPLLAVQPASLAHGVNMQAGPGRDLIWLGLTDSLELYSQLNARLHRQGVTGQVRVHRILARGTVDEAVRSRLMKKDEGQESLLIALAEYRRRKEPDGRDI